MLDTDPQAEAILSTMMPYLTLEVAVETEGFRKRNLLHHAAIHVSETVTQKCLDLGVDVNARDREGRTALHYAAVSSWLPIVKMLVQTGSDIEALDNFDHTPLARVLFVAYQRYRMSDKVKGWSGTPHYDIITYLLKLSRAGVGQAHTINMRRFSEVSSSETSDE